MYRPAQSDKICCISTVSTKSLLNFTGRIPRVGLRERSTFTRFSARLECRWFLRALLPAGRCSGRQRPSSRLQIHRSSRLPFRSLFSVVGAFAFRRNTSLLWFYLQVPGSLKLPSFPGVQIIDFKLYNSTRTDLCKKTGFLLTSS